VACAIVGFILYFIIPSSSDLQRLRRRPAVDDKFLIKASHFVVDYFYVCILFRCSSGFPQAGVPEQDGRLYLRPNLVMIPVMVRSSRSRRRPDHSNTGYLGAVGRADPGIAQHRPRHGGQHGVRAAFTRIYDSIREGETIAQRSRGPDRGRHRRQHDRRREETGDLDTMLNKIADNYDERLRPWSKAS